MTNISIEARMTSTRLPGKVMKPIWKDMSSLEFMVNRLKKVANIDNIIVATTTNGSDEPIVELCSKLGVEVYRGDEDDVLTRVLEAHEHFNSDIVVELTGDCPLIDPQVVDSCLEYYKKNDFDYVSNCLIRSFPDGMDVQVYSIETLKIASVNTKDMKTREHVTPYIYQSGVFSIGHVKADNECFWPDLEVTLDTIEDYELIKKIIEHFDSNFFTLPQIVDYLKNNNSLLSINQMVKRKGLN